MKRGVVKRGVLFREPVGVALETLRQHKMRSFLMLLGIILSVSTLIVVISLISGVNKYIAEARLDPTKMPGEYAAINRPQGPDDWKTTDIIATAALVGGIFGNGGGGEHCARTCSCPCAWAWNCVPTEKCALARSA